MRNRQLKTKLRITATPNTRHQRADDGGGTTVGSKRMEIDDTAIDIKRRKTPSKTRSQKPDKAATDNAVIGMRSGQRHTVRTV